MKRLVSISLILLILISGGLIFDYSAPDTASASVIDKIELTDQRTRTSKTYWLGETPEGNQRYALDASIGSIHYEENGQWLDIDPSIRQSEKANWDWEVVKGSYTLLIKDDTSVAVGKDGHWLGFRYEGFAYLDKSNNEYVILDNRQAVTPVVVGNKITWEGIFYGVNLEYIYGNDGFKENLEITQAARDWLSTHPPSSYGLNNQTTYLVGYIECDWRYSYNARAGNELVDWEQAVELEGQIDFWHPHKRYIVSALPTDYAFSASDPQYEPLKLRKRFIEKNGDHYLLFGGKVTDLNQFPTGTIVFDPTVDVQVGASGDDGYITSTGTFNDSVTYVDCGDGATPTYSMWALFSGVSIEGTIDVSYMEWAVYVVTGSAQLKVFGVDLDNPAAPTSVAEYNADPHTTASVDFDGHLGGGWVDDTWNRTNSLNTIFQELVDSYTISNENVMVQAEDDGGGNNNYVIFRSWDYSDGSSAVKLHLEYTAGGVSIPTVVTNAVTDIQQNQATGNGNMTATGGENADFRGFEWGTSTGNYTSNTTESGNYSIGTFSLNMTALSAGTEYFHRAMAHNTAGWGYGSEVSFNTTAAASAPTVATYNATSVEETTATLVGNITATGGENPTHRGFYWDIDSGNPYANNDITSGNYGVGQFTYGATSLTEGELYYYIATANNSGGTGNGTEIQFFTKPDEPTGLTATTQTSSNISLSWSNGSGRDTTLIRHRTDQYPTGVADGTQSYNGTGTSTTVTGLTAGQIYYFRGWSWASEGGFEEYSDLTSDVTDYTLPGDPSGMVAENVTATSIDVRWTKGTGGDYTMARRKIGSYPTGVSDGDQAYYNTSSDFSDSGLSKGTAYYYRAWARDTDSNYYSATYTQATATTNITAPTVTNASGATSISDTSAQLNGEITDNGGNSTTAFVYWGATDGTDNASAWDNWENRGVQAGTFSFTTSNLTALTQYFYRCYATNSEGTDWADTTANFTTTAFVEEVVIPTGTTTPAAVPSLQIWLYLIAFSVTGIAYWQGDRLLYILAGLALITIGFTAWATSYYISILLVVWGMCNFVEASVMRRAI